MTNFCKTVRCFVLLGLMICLIMTPEMASATSPLPHDGLPTDTHICYVGRWDKSNPAEYHSYWTAPYLRVGFTGTSVKIKLAEKTSLNVVIDGG